MFSKLIQIVQNYQGGRLFLIANIIVMICVGVLFMAIIIDFMEYHNKKNVKNKVRSWVETGSMFGVYVIYYLLIRFRIGQIVPHEALHHVMLITGSAIMIFGCYVNVSGRFKLKHNWANQVTIYKNQTMITGGVYCFVRHPLYASIIWMMISGSLIYSNYISLLSVLIIFIPMMYYRANQEEKLLASEFEGYKTYQKNVGMFFPKLFKIW
jgi:protein-S-isoprenylcysteine O-methyltransferase Ste14